MKLFDRLPPNLFSILVSKNKALYAEALFVLRKAFKQHMTISKSDLVAMLIASLDEALLDLDLEAEKMEFEEAEEEVKGGQGRLPLRTDSQKAHGYKWIEVEYQMDSFEEIITLPDYTIKLLDLLYSLRMIRCANTIHMFIPPIPPCAQPMQKETISCTMLC